MSFGEILRETRERKGLDINATARRLHIRLDILQAIEDSNFAAMPPRGYSRNMVNGYARYLGLNATDITARYLDELYAYQVGAARASQPLPRASRARTQSSTRTQQSGRSGRDESARGRSRTESGRSAAEGSPRARNTREVHNATRSTSPNSSYTNLYSAPTIGKQTPSRLPFIIAAAVLLVVIIIVCIVIFGGKAQTESASEVPNLPVSGVSGDNATVGQGTAATTSETVLPAPTKFTFEYTVAKDQQSWIEVSIDDEHKVAEQVTGPSTQSFDCSGTLQFICANPDAVTIKQDGQELEMTPSDSGVVNMTIKFDDVLKKWQQEHPQSTTASSGTSSSTVTASTSGTTAANTNNATLDSTTSSSSGNSTDSDSSSSSGSSSSNSSSSSSSSSSNSDSDSDEE